MRLSVRLCVWALKPSVESRSVTVLALVRRVILARDVWAIVPSAMNLGGATDRPDLEQVWDNVRAKTEGKGTVHNSYKTMGLLGLLWGKLFD